MQRAPSGKRNSRTHSSRYVAFLLAALTAAVAPAAAQAAAQGGSPAYGGTQTVERPVITGVSCLARCGTTARRSLRAVAVQANGKLKIRGRNMSGVRTVIFTGGYGSRDDVRVDPEGVGRLSVDVTVPDRARTGRVVLLAASYSPPSAQPVIVVPKEREDDDDDDDGDDGGDHGDGGGDAVNEGTGPVAGQRLSWPVPKAPIYGVFGENRGSHRHSGVDISGPVGTPVRAAAGGRVILSAPSGAYGNFICVAHSSLSSCYAHLSDLPVSVGTSVSQGQIIGHIGMTGNSSGAHLHFEVRSGTRPWAPPVDPLGFLSGGAALVRGGSHDHTPAPQTLRRLPAAWGP